MSTCRTCGAEIIWAHTTAGKRIPLDVAQSIHGRGRFALVERAGKPPLAMALLEASATPGHVSHFATCPDAAKHRRSR